MFDIQRFDGLVWLLLLTLPLFFIQNRLHFETQAVFLLLTRRGDISTALFAIIFFPGVLLHESSHFIVARLLGVKTRNFSIIPSSKPDGRMQLGYVETERTDILRDALIGVAPLIAGGIFVTYAGLRMLGLGSLWVHLSTGDLAQLIDQTLVLSKQPDFWIWLYLTVAVSSTMLPSASDRRAWIPVGIVVLIVFSLSVLAGAGPWLMENIAPYVSIGLRAAAIVFGLSLILQLIFLLPVWGMRIVISRVTNLKVV